VKRIVLILTLAILTASCASRFAFVEQESTLYVHTYVTAEDRTSDDALVEVIRVLNPFQYLAEALSSTVNPIVAALPLAQGLGTALPIGAATDKQLIDSRIQLPLSDEPVTVVIKAFAPPQAPNGAQFVQADVTITCEGLDVTPSAE
jgi:hypothetical protein